MIEISTRIEYDYIVSRGHCPLINWKMFKMNHNLRIEIQYDLFNAVDFQKQNQKFYKWVWDNSIHCCFESGKPLHDYSAVFISHIISRGSDRRMSIDPRNVNILCFDAHQKWENKDNFKMNIWRENQLIIKMLKSEYNGNTR